MSATNTALVIGGTGPTGPFIVNGLIERGFAVTILHTGRHEIDEIPPEVEHIHTDPFDVEQLTQALDGRTFDLTIATYGRLRRTAEVMVGKTGRFLSIGGGPAYLGYMNAGALTPAGLPMPVGEDAAKVRDEALDGKGFRIVLTEEQVFDVQPDATHFRYPYIYGPYQIAPREWCIVRRILDQRPFIILGDGGLSLNHYGYAGNMAHAVLLAVDQPEVSRGQIYNCGDADVLTLAQVVEIIATGLGAELPILNMPAEIASPANPLNQQPWTTHRVFDLTKIRRELGYTDIFDPREALVSSARWLVAHPHPAGGVAEKVLQDPFDYAAEDALAAAWQKALASVPDPTYAGPAPGYGTSYSGPGGKPRSKPFE